MEHLPPSFGYDGRASTRGNSEGSVEAEIVAPFWTVSTRLLVRLNAPVRYTPGAGNSTVPPPADEHAPRAAAMAAVSRVFPSPFAPKSFTLKTAA